MFFAFLRREKTSVISFAYLGREGEGSSLQGKNVLLYEHFYAATKSGGAYSFKLPLSVRTYFRPSVTLCGTVLVSATPSVFDLGIRNLQHASDMY